MRLTVSYYADVERVIRADRALAVAAAAAQDFNDELTVILSSVSVSLSALEPEHPARERLLDVQAAAQRCAWKAAGLLVFGTKRGTSISNASLESLLDM